MSKWIPCGNGFIEADVIRSNEGVSERRGRRKRVVTVDHGRVTGEVSSDDGDGWVQVLVRACEITDEKPGRQLTPLPLGQEVRRKRHTISHGKPERLTWSDETPRGALYSRFLGRLS